MFTRPSRERSLLAPTSSGTTRYSTTSAMTNRTMPRRNGLTKKGSQVRQPRHQLRQVLLASASAPGFRSAFAGSVRISSPLPGLRARTPPHVQQPAQGYPAQERTLDDPSERGGRGGHGTDGEVNVDPVRAHSRGNLLRARGPFGVRAGWAARGLAGPLR